MVTVKIRETYDLSTKANRLTLIGIHTPSRNIIERLYPGFCEQYKMCKIRHQNVRIASASRLPLDPAGVGANAEGLVSPEDVFNPILYKAVSNASLSNFEYRIRGLQANLTTPSVDGESATAYNDKVTAFNSDFNVYYTLLSNTRGWRVAHPQAGLSMGRLRPLVYESWYNEGVNALPAIGSFPQIPVDSSEADGEQAGGHITMTNVASMRGRPHRMPQFNTKYLTGVDDGNGASGEPMSNGMATGVPRNSQIHMPRLPTIYTGLIIVPPSRNTVLYYRMVVETVISFWGVQTMDEISSLAGLDNRSAFPVYWNDYRSESSKLVNKEDTVDVSEGAELRKIMEA